MHSNNNSDLATTFLSRKRVAMVSIDSTNESFDPSLEMLTWQCWRHGHTPNSNAHLLVLMSHICRWLLPVTLPSLVRRSCPTWLKELLQPTQPKPSLISRLSLQLYERGGRERERESGKKHGSILFTLSTIF